MLTLKSLEVVNFGPYAGHQRIDFAPEGVTVVYGENFHGKTTLLNALRFALYGQVLGRGAERRALRTVSNRDRVREGVYEFQAILSFDHDGEAYELVRTAKPRPGVSKPRLDADFSVTPLLRVGGEVKSPAETEHLLATILPHEVARFFLFDGELLMEYEQLLIDNSEVGERIAREIERILGVPYLTRGHSHLRFLGEQAEGEVSAETRKTDKAAGIQAQLDNAIETRSRRRDELEIAEKELGTMIAERERQEQYLADQQLTERRMEEKREREADLRQAEKEEIDARIDVQEALREAWRGLVAPNVQGALEQGELAAKRALGDVELALRSQAITSGTCGVCEHDLSGAEAERLRVTLNSDGLDPATVISKASAEIGRVAVLARFADTDRSDDVARAWARLEDAQLGQASARARIEEIESELDNVSVQDVGQSRTTVRSLSEKIAVHTKAVEDTRAAITSADAQVKRLSKELEAAGVVASPEIKARRDLLQSAASVFEAAIGIYRDELRDRVAQDASAFFMKMISRPEYFTGLKINNSYGLSLILADGEVDEGRSSGQEHIIALALIAALQKNAPIGGPIVADSSFTRLDGTNSKNIIGTVPTMAPQTVILVFRSEVDQGLMREILGTDLKQEYEIVSVSQNESRLQAVTG